jgi:hypothetical protein
MFVTAVLCPDPAAFEAWCRSNRYLAAGDGAEAESGRWLAIRVLAAADLEGVTVDRLDYALDFWRRGDGEAIIALDAVARTRLRRPGPAVGGGVLRRTARGQG